MCEIKSTIKYNVYDIREQATHLNKLYLSLIINILLLNLKIESVERTECLFIMELYNLGPELMLCFNSAVVKNLSSVNDEIKFWLEL